MRKVGLLAFGITTLLLAPAVLHELTAGPRQIAKLVAPGLSSVELGGATIAVSADRAIAAPGDVVHVTLRATAPKAARVSASVLVLESLGTYNGRVEQPPNRVMLETFALDARPGGGAPKEVAIRLPGKRVGELDLGRYTVLVMEPKAAAKLDRARGRAQREGRARGFDPMESAAPKHAAWGELYYHLSTSNSDADAADDEAVPAGRRAARLEVLMRPASAAVAIRAPEQAVVGREFSIAVQVTNPTKRHIRRLDVRLQEPPIYSDYLGLDLEQVSRSSGIAVIELGPRETRQVEFRLTAKQVGTLGLYASIHCSDCDDARLTDGSLEAIDITPAPKAEPPKAEPAKAAPAAAAR